MNMYLRLAGRLALTMAVLQLGAGQAIAADDERAVGARQADFDQHLKNIKSFKKAMPPMASTGAAPDAAEATLSGDQSAQAQDGPSKAITTMANTPDGQVIETPRPPLQSLIQFNHFLDPFTLDATATRTITLRDALFTGLERNLDLAIARTNTKQKQFSYYSALGNFLPDPTLGFSEYFSSGRVGLPFNVLGSAATGGSGAFAGRANRDTTIRVNRPFEVMHAGAQFYAYRGGSVLFGSLQARNNYRAAKHQEMANLSDTLMTVTQNYYNLKLAEALLQIRIDAVRTSEEQLKRNRDRYGSGLATNLEVLQSKTQLARDRQALIDQQANRRNASLTLAESLNLPLGEDVVPQDLAVRKVRLISPSMTVGQLLTVAIDNRPELKQYEELRLAARKAVIVAAANLQPSVALSGNAYGIGPPSNVELLGVFAVNINWRLRGFGVVDSMDMANAKWQARQASLQAQKQLQMVCRQVRNSYVQMLDRERNVEEAGVEVVSALEELRLAELRKASGLGLNLDIIAAQRDYTQARVSQAQAVINYNIAQAQLLRDLGVISTDALTSGKLLTAQAVGGANKSK